MRGILCLMMLVLSCFSQHVPINMGPQVLKDCPENNASFLSRVSFWWMNGLIMAGYRHPLTSAELWSLNYQDTTAVLSSKFLKYLKLYLARKRPARHSLQSTKTNSKGAATNGKQNELSPEVVIRQPLVAASKNDKKKSEPFDGALIKVLFRTFGGMFMTSAVFKLGNDLLMFVAPYLLKKLINFVSATDQPMWCGYFFAIILFVISILTTFILQQYFHYVFSLGMRMRTALIAAIYRKALVLSNVERKDTTVGEIVNHMSVDAQKFLDLMPFIHMVWSGPLQIIIAIVFLWQELGVAVLAGLAVILLLVPVNGVISNFSRKFQMKQMALKDRRIKLMNEVLTGIRVLKLYAWEPYFIKEVESIRKQELTVLRHSAFLHAVNSFTFSCAPLLVSLTSFGVYVAIAGDRVLDAERAFVSLSLFNILRFPLMMFPMVITGLVQASVSLQRLTKFLRRSEVPKDNVERISDPHGLGKLAGRIENGNFSWDTIVDKPSTTTNQEPQEEGNNSASTSPDGLILRDLNIDIPKGKLVAVIGTVGAGKTSLLSALLGEMELITGHVTLCGRVAYVPQQAWILNASVCENILFHNKNNLLDGSDNGLYNEEKEGLIHMKEHDQYYQRVLRSCQLLTDLNTFSDGDKTEIGEKGVNLSGGQKQRISLARACYANADVYLLDDPLSAVDAHVSKALMEQVLCGNGLLKDKTRVLVTHNITVLPKCDHIIVLDGGRVRQSGTYAELLQDSSGSFAAFIATHLAGNNHNDEELSDLLEEDLDESDPESVARIQAKKQELEEQERILSELSQCLEKNGCNSNLKVHHLKKSRENIRKSLQSLDRVAAASSPEKRNLSRGVSKTPDKKEPALPATAKKLIEDEKMNVGQVSWKVYLIYLRAVGLPFSFFILSLYLASHAASLGYNLWLADWTEDAANLTATAVMVYSENSTLDNDAKQYWQAYLKGQKDYRLGVYGALGMLQTIMATVGSIVFALGTLRSCRLLHASLLNRVLRLPMQRFDSMPLGRLLNRFSNDMSTVDMQLPHQWQMWLATLLQCLSTLVAVSIPNQLIILPLCAVIVFYYLMQRFYVSTSRQLKRLESVSRSPIYSHFSETLQGVSSIRAYDKCDTFIRICEERVDINLRAYYPNVSSNRWLAIRLEFVANLIVLFAALFAVMSRDWGWGVTAGYAGLSISYAMGVTQTLNWMVRMSSELETNIVSVERIQEFSELPTEAEWEIQENKPAADWPQRGQLEFRNYSTRYREDLSPVLENINFSASAGEKIGIVGRTGSGKSSLVLGLFRILEPMPGSSIILDSQDLTKLGLHDVRGRLTIIPQDPVLFSGSLRLNLDPANKKTDEELWNALESANLKNFIVETSGEAGLQMAITEGGENLSVGQRQLVCLARALLRKTRVLVLDEATAAVDLDTDLLIQKTIREDFVNSTVLTIAHRLHTIMDYNRILVLDKGKIIEFDTPQNLLAKPDGVFAAMAKDADL